MIFAPALTEGSVIKDLKGNNITETKKPCLTTIEPQHQLDTVPKWRLKNTTLAALQAQGIVCSHVMVPFVLLWSTQLVSQTKPHNLKRRNPDSTKYHVLYILECETLKLPPGVLLSKLQSIPPIRHCAHLFPLSCPILRAFKHNNGIYIGNSISTSLQSSRLIMLTYARSA